MCSISTQSIMSEQKNLRIAINMVQACTSNPNTDAHFCKLLSDYPNPTPKETQYISLALLFRKIILKARRNPPRVAPSGPEQNPVEPPEPH